MIPTDRSVKQIDFSPHPGEEHLHAVFREADEPSAEVVARARRMGVKWPAIVSILLQHGPAFAGVLNAILEALKTPPPQPPDMTEEELADVERRQAEEDTRHEQELLAKRREAKAKAKERDKQAKAARHETPGTAQGQKSLGTPAENLKEDKPGEGTMHSLNVPGGPNVEKSEREAPGDHHAGKK